MEAAFMAHRAQLLNKIFLTALSFFLFSCEHDKTVVPAVFINANENAFTTKQGITYLNNTSFSGWKFSLYENGDTAYTIPYYEGKENGNSKTWYENKQLEEIRVFENGKKIGVHKGWWPDGKQKFEYHFNNDVYEGNVKEWFPSGQLYKSFNYKNGQENGMQQQYFKDGRIQLNYESRNGRNYGLTGVKNCINVKDSIGIER